ncbi:hypothetical protein Efla_000303 [Eimeria flavescens]
MARRLFIVTGGSRGIGFETTKQLCKQLKDENATVLLTSRCPVRGKTAVSKLAEEGLTASMEQLDITDKESISTFARAIEGKYKKVDCLVNNAGFMFSPRAKEPFATQANVTCSINYFGTRNLSKAIAPLLARGARVVNVASTEAQRALKEMNSEHRHLLMSRKSTIEDIDLVVKQFLDACETGSLGGWSKNIIGFSKAAVIAMTAACARLSDKRPETQMVITSCCPGWCQTDLTAWGKAPLSAADGAAVIAPLALHACREHHGKFVKKEEILDLSEN